MKNPDPTVFVVNGKRVSENDTFKKDDRYFTEKIEAYNVAIESLREHEPANPQPDGLDRALRERLATKLDREIQRWVEKHRHLIDR